MNPFRADKSVLHNTARRRGRWAAIMGAGFLAGSFAPVAVSSAVQPLPPADTTAPATPSAPPRTLSFHNLHTEEIVTVTYWRDGDYDPAALQQVAHVLRDHRRNEVQSIDPALLDTLHTIQQDLRPRYPRSPMVFQVISGFRARETTDALRRDGAAVAGDTSQHQMGYAVDFRIDGVPLRELRDTAWCLQRGGVGYYPQRDNNFIHVDVGRVRFWPGSRTPWRCMS